MVIGRQRWRRPGSLPPILLPFGSGLRVSNYRRRVALPAKLFFAKGERVCRHAAMHLQILEAGGRLTWRYVANGSHLRMNSTRAAVLTEPKTRMEG